ncbi:MAG: hypothetical protein ABIY70_18090 [Capsulimonas sp.]|uniref:TolB family protein n=1 Tax=Capsulimonas sp. TaxID=2494211 RepID=UPI003266D6DB
MTDFPAPEDASPSPDHLEATPPAGETPGAPAPRKVYESNLLPDRRRRLVSPWVLFPLLLIGFGAACYFFLYAPQKQRHIPTAGQIVFASDRNTPGVSHLWALTLGGAARALTSGPSPDTSPVYSPDGDQIAFLSPRQLGKSQVFVMDADGQNPSPATRMSGTKDIPSFAPSDNQLIAYTAGGILYRLDLSTKAVEQLVPMDADASHHHSGSEGDSQETPSSTLPTTVPNYAWRPGLKREEQGLAAVQDKDGLQTLAVLPNPDADLIANLDGNPNVPLIAADSMSIGWSPTGGLLAVAAIGVKGVPGGKPFSGIILFDSQGKAAQSTPPVRLASATGGPENPVFTPDGAEIVFELWDQPDVASRKCVGLFAAAVDASAQPRLIVKGNAEHIMISHDSKTVYYLTARAGGKHDLCSIGLDGTGFQRLSDGVEDVTRFSLSPQ